MESFPSGEITPYGITLLTEGIEPLITYIDPDGELAFYLNGGLAPWPGVTEGVVLKDGIQGLHPPFNHLDHRTARQHGVVNAGTVYDPAEIDMDVLVTARTPEGYRNIVRKWMAAWNPEKRGTLSWVTPDGGEWWCHPRLLKAPPDRLTKMNARLRQQEFTWTVRNDDAFWRSHDSVGTFEFGATGAQDNFNRNDSGTLGVNWDQTYSGGSTGVCETDGTRAVWTPSGTGARTVINRWLGSSEVQTVTVVGSPTTWALNYGDETTAAITHPATTATVRTALNNLGAITSGDVVVTGSTGGPYTITFAQLLATTPIDTMSGTILSGGTDAYVTVGATNEGQPVTTVTDLQVIKSRFGDFHTFPLPGTSYCDIWGRLNTAGTSGIRLRIGVHDITLSRFNAGVETVMRERPLVLAPLWWETWTLICGTGTNSRHFKVLRNGFPVMSVKESGTGSLIGASYRGAGFGMKAGAGSSQGTPPSVFEWSMDDNLEGTRSGHVTVTNYGTQDAYPDLIVYGPGTFKFGDGPSVDPTVEFGPLADGQVALIKTQPGQRSVYDITADSSDQDLPFFQDFLTRVISLAFNNNVPPLLDYFKSLFGIEPQQVYLYKLLRGRFTKPVLGRSAGSLPTAAQINIEITGGNSESRVVAALTPLCRWPE